MSNGAKPCVYVALRALINPGDEVILPSPYWVSYSELIKMTGGVPVIVETREADHFKLTAQELRDAITPKTKAMILNNPSNPTGMMYSRKELEEIAKVCVEQDIYVICDEIYYHLVYDGEGVCQPGRHQPRDQVAHPADQRCLQVLCHDRLAHRLCGR